jgi:hypothetical protein
MTKRLRSLIVAAVTCFVIDGSSLAFAAPAPDPADFVVIESPGRYTVYNNSTDWYVYGFAVSNPGAISGATASTSFTNWGAMIALVDFDSGPVPAFAYASADANLTDINNPSLNVFNLANYLAPGASSSDFTFNPVLPDSTFGLALVSASEDLATVTGPTSETPLPAALPLFASGAGLIGLLTRRRKRKEKAATFETHRT